MPRKLTCLGVLDLLDLTDPMILPDPKDLVGRGGDPPSRTLYNAASRAKLEGYVHSSSPGQRRGAIMNFPVGTESGPDGDGISVPKHDFGTEPSSPRLRRSFDGSKFR